MQPSNASLPMVFRPVGRLMVARLSQSLKAPASMTVTASGMVISTRLLQPLKQSLLMTLMLEGRTAFVRFFAPEKRPFGSSLACVLIPPLSLLSTIVIPERSTVFTKHSSGFFLSVFVRVMISWSSLRSVPLRAPLTVRSATLNFCSPIWVANLPTESTFIFTEFCAMASIGSVAMRIIISFFIFFLFCFVK